MQFADLENVFGTRVFEPAAYDPILDAPRSKRTVGEQKALFADRPSILPIVTNYVPITD